MCVCVYVFLLHIKYARPLPLVSLISVAMVEDVLKTLFFFSFVFVVIVNKIKRRLSIRSTKSHCISARTNADTLFILSLDV